MAVQVAPYGVGKSEELVIADIVQEAVVRFGNTLAPAEAGLCWNVNDHAFDCRYAAIAPEALLAPAAPHRNM